MLMVAEGAPEVVLASASPTRRALLQAAGVPHRVQPAAIDEAEIKAALQADGTAPGEAAVSLAELKAERISARVDPNAIVLGSDQILTADGHWFDKPVNQDAARAQLLTLRARRHELWTAVVAYRANRRIWHDLTESRLWVRDFSEAFVDAYLEGAGSDVLGSVGTYQIEGPGGQLFARIQGDPFSIQGLPLLPLLEFLRTQGVLIR